MTEARRERDDGTGLASRRLAAEVLTAVLDQRLFLEDAEARYAEERAALEPRDRAFAHALTLACLRGLGRIDAEIDDRLSKPLPDGAAYARTLLRLGAAEILFFDTPDYAAVDAAVRAAKSDAHRYAGLVNAVLRRIAERADEIRDKASLAPRWFAQRLAQDWGETRARGILQAHEGQPPLDLSLRSPAEAEAWAERFGGVATPGDGVRLNSAGAVTELPGYAEGAWWVQDAAAAVPARILSVEKPPARVLDLCAAPGGKTLQLAALGAEVTALDISERRAERLRENLDRTGLSAEIVCADAQKWRPSRPFDAVLLDAPCSASGTVRRHPELPWIKTEAGLPDLATLQDRLLDAAWEMVAPGGRLVFCTCSLFRIEGEARAASFQERRDAARPVVIDPKAVGAPAASRTEEGALRILPDMWAGQGGVDGFYIAAFDKASS